MDDLTRELVVLPLVEPKPQPIRPSTPEQQKLRRDELNRNWLPPKHLRGKT